MQKTFAILLVGLAACTQQPAEIVYKGSEFFGRDGGYQPTVYDTASQYSSTRSNEPGFVPQATGHSNSYTTEPAAPIGTVSTDSVGVRELGAPEPASISISPKPAQTEGYVERSYRGSNALPPRDLPFAKQVPPKPGEVAESAYDRELAQNGSISFDSIAKEYKAASAQTADYIWPVRGEVLSQFGTGPDGQYHDGINIAAQEGDAIRAAADGTVAYTGNDLKGYGNMVILRHVNGYMTAYAHARDIRVKMNDKVKQGDMIGTVGKTGDVKTAQLHFGLRDGKKPVNPMRYLPRDVADIH
jgi:murein DD-endopeptidase MepM/ murein hydrolase activator NlpD